MKAWPIAVAALVRLLVWLAMPAGRFASDEESYFAAASTLLAGRQDVFWPPVTGWVIAALRLALGTDALPVLRSAWLAMDLACVAATSVLARRAAESVPALAGQAGRLAVLASLAYALYLPAISYAQFMTSETPALLLVLLVMLILTSPRPSMSALAGAGLLAGFLVLTRPSLLPLLVLWPLGFAVTSRDRSLGLRAAVMVTLAGVVVGGWMLRNKVVAGELTVSTNSAYNLYIGNRAMYAEDLNLFSPKATPEQVMFRRQQWNGTLAHPTLSTTQMQEEALRWIAAHPAQFLRRATGRLARVFVPRTDVLELVGGEAAAGVFSWPSLTVLAIANLQWAMILGAGVVGLVVLRSGTPGRLFLLTIAGSVALCLVAISKPRYSFVFEPLLIVAAITFASSPGEQWRRLARAERRTGVGTLALLAWGWIAWLIFAFTSRLPDVS